MIKPFFYDERVNIKTDIENKGIKDNNDEMHQEHFSWFESTTPEEERLLNKIYEFEDKYFSDLTLKDYKKDISGSRKKENGKWVTTYADLLLNEKVSFIDNGWKVQFFDQFMYFEGFYGFCDRKERIVGIAEPLKEHDSTLLHEMIHGYESMLVPYFCYHQLVLIKLYEKLLPQIPNLNKIIEWDIHTRNTVNHSPLLLLKSLDLDIRLKQPFGTIYGYEREWEFRKFRPYAVKYRLLNANKSRKYHELIKQMRFSTVEDAKGFIVTYHRERMEKAKSKMVGFFPELGRPKPIEYYVFKRNDNNKYTILIKTIKEKEISY